MFDFAWSELGVIAVVALVFIGPKDMPVALKAVTGMIKKARRMASEFQGHVDDMMREADLHEVRDQISALRGYNVGRALEKLVDDDGSLRKSFDDPFKTPPISVPAASPTPLIDADVAVAERPEIETEPAAPVAEPEPARDPGLPAFIPPGYASSVRAPAPAAEAPAFIPPQIARAESAAEHRA